METVAFKHFTHQDLLDKTLIVQLKKVLIFFDRLLVPIELFEKTREFLEAAGLPEELKQILKSNLHEIELLEQYELLSKYSHLADYANLANVGFKDNQDLNRLVLQVRAAGQEIISEAGTASADDFLDSRVQYGDLVSRVSALLHRKAHSINGVPLVNSFQTNLFKIDTEQVDVAQVVLRKFPVPTPATDWERIIGFREDDAVQKSITELTMWMDDISKSGKDRVAIELELESMINRYREYMDVHKMMYDMGCIRSVIRVTADILGNVAKLNWGTAADSVCNILSKNIELTKAEIDAPGRQVAFFYKAEDCFQS